MTINKRMGFKPRGINAMTLTQESFDATFQFRPFKLYQIVSEDDAYAITGEKESDSAFLSKPDKNNKFQWVFIDADTGAICFFNDLKNYMNIDMVNGIVKVKRSDILLHGTFNFKADNTITLKDYPKHYLGFTKIGTNTPAAKSDANSESPAVGEKKQESFISRFFGLFESFNASTEPELEAIPFEIYDKEPNKYSNKWKYVELMDLRDLTNNADTIKELEKIGDNDDKQITLLNRKIENAKAISELEIEYRQNKIDGYEDHWFIKHFLK